MKWSHEYLQRFQSRHSKYDYKPTSVMGQTVLLRDQSTSRLLWSLRRTTQLHPGTDAIDRASNFKSTSFVSLNIRSYLRGEII